MTTATQGANLSGDLKDPQRHIWRGMFCVVLSCYLGTMCCCSPPFPTGTLWAIFVSFLTYVFAMFAFAGGFDRFTLRGNFFVYQEVSFGTEWIIVVGILISTFSSGLGKDTTVDLFVILVSLSCYSRLLLLP